MNVAIAQVYPARIEAARRLLADDALCDDGALRACAERIREAATVLARAPAGADWRTYADAIEVLALLVEWRRATRDAQADADRFLRAARFRLKDIEAGSEASPFVEDVSVRLNPISADFTVEQVPDVLRAIGTLAMPLAIFAEPEPTPQHWMRGRVIDESPPAEDVAVAFLEFTINGKPAETLQSLPAGQVHDLDLAIRVSRWPNEAEKLLIAPVTIEPPSTWDFPTFEFSRPDGDPPFIFQRRGRMTLHARQGINARPLEFRYAAEFQPVEKDERVVIAGQRTLLLDGSPAAGWAITGDASVDRKIIELRDWMRREPRIAEDDVADMLVLLSSVGNLMWQSVRSNHYPEAIDEATFQRDFQRHLRTNTDIGNKLEEQAGVARGKSDLTFRGIRIELKSEPDKLLAPNDCEQYAAQAASYAVGTGRSVALLCVLDCSPKTTIPFPVADGLTIFPVETATAPLYVVCCLIQGNLGRPSDLSR